MQEVEASEELRSKKVEKKKEEAPAWDPEPPKVAFRRFSLGVAESMGSSNLASLSEAGGNNPYHPLSGPLPPHLKNDADRVERDPRRSHCKSGAQTRECEPGGWLFI